MIFVPARTKIILDDAIVHSAALAAQGLFPGGGADGSMLIFPDVEPNFGANNGISDSVELLNTNIVPKHPDISAGDIIQFGTAIAVSLCPGGPKLEFFAGRPNATLPGPPGLIPEPQDSVDQILTRFDDAAGFTSDEVVALLASHSIARADHVDESLKGAPFDTTPFTFDTQFFLETLLKGTGFPGTGNNVGEVESPLPLTVGDEAGEIRLQSDFALARDPRTACTWQGFINQQQKMADAFGRAMAKLAVVGVDKSTLVDCSEAIPWPKAAAWPPATYVSFYYSAAYISLKPVLDTRRRRASQMLSKLVLTPSQVSPATKEVSRVFPNDNETSNMFAPSH